MQDTEIDTRQYRYYTCLQEDTTILDGYLHRPNIFPTAGGHLTRHRHIEKLDSGVSQCRCAVMNDFTYKTHPNCVVSARWGAGGWKVAAKVSVSRRGRQGEHTSGICTYKHTSIRGDTARTQDALVGDNISRRPTSDLITLTGTGWGAALQETRRRVGGNTLS